MTQDVQTPKKEAGILSRIFPRKTADSKVQASKVTKEDLEKYKHQKLDEVNKMYLKAGKKLWPTLQRFHKGIVITARNNRLAIRKGKEYQKGIEEQVARSYRAVQYKGVWTRTFFDEIPKAARMCIDKNTAKLSDIGGVSSGDFPISG